MILELRQSLKMQITYGKRRKPRHESEGSDCDCDLSQYLTNLMHKICFTISFISYLYMFRANVLIIRRSKLHYTASGIITLCRWPSRARDGHLQSVMIPEAV